MGPREQAALAAGFAVAVLLLAVAAAVRAFSVSEGDEEGDSCEQE